MKLNPEIDDFDREWVVNGIRGYLDKTDIIFTKQQMKESVESISAAFSLFVAIIGVIALFIMFFLLMISMTQNITEAVWEYGVLRSMGLTLAEGRRVYMYEAYTVVATSTFLGLVVGLIACILVSAQLFTFVEMPPKLLFPTWTFFTMILMMATTTYIAVYVPIKKVNEKQIAAVLKSGA